MSAIKNFVQKKQYNNKKNKTIRNSSSQEMETLEKTPNSEQRIELISESKRK